MNFTVQNAMISCIYMKPTLKTMFKSITQCTTSVLMCSTHHINEQITHLPNFTMLEKKSLRAEKNLQRNSTTMIYSVYV